MKIKSDTESNHRSLSVSLSASVGNRTLVSSLTRGVLPLHYSRLVELEGPRLVNRDGVSHKVLLAWHVIVEGNPRLDP